MREAFSYIFKDNCLFQKTWIYITLLAITNILIGISKTGSHIIARPELLSTNPTEDILIRLGVVIISMFTTGYFLSAISANIKQKNNILLPRFNAINNFAKGLKFLFAVFLPVLVISVILGSLQSIFGSIIPTIFFGIIAIFYLIYGGAFVWNFADSNNIFVFFNFRKTVKDVAQNSKRYFKHISLMWLIILSGAVIASVVEFIIGFTLPSDLIAIVLWSIIGAFISAYVALISAFLIGKSLPGDSVV